MPYWLDGDAGIVVLAVGFALFSLAADVRRRRRIEAKIIASARFKTTPIQFRGSRLQCVEAEAAAADLGWRKISDGRWWLFWRRVRFVPARKDSAIPQTVLRALDQIISIQRIDLPGRRRKAG